MVFAFLSGDWAIGLPVTQSAGHGFVLLVVGIHLRFFLFMTGLVTGFYPLLLVRFLFGVGEAGAFPNASVAIARWMPLRERGRAYGFIFMSSQVGGMVAPLLVVPIRGPFTQDGAHRFMCLGSWAWRGACSGTDGSATLREKSTG